MLRPFIIEYVSSVKSTKLDILLSFLRVLKFQGKSKSYTKVGYQLHSEVHQSVNIHNFFLGMTFCLCIVCYGHLLSSM
ncbi:hypothetical protein Hdeb2414_s0221g00837961 [Helianthus debilis subsp. tardiflorus]